MRKKILKILSFVLVLCTVISATSISASALSWDGSSTGGGGNTTSAGPNGYAIRTDADNCIGYRFSVVDKNGNQKGTKVIDVFRNTYYGNLEYSSGYKFNTKYNKIQLIRNQNYGFGTSKNTTNCYKEADMGFTNALPAPSEIGTWQNNKNNLNPALYNIGINGGINSLKNGDKVLIEPLYDLRLESVYHAVTVTETAIYGKHILGASSNGGSSSNSGSWGFISSYTNKYYPNELYTSDGQGLWTGVSALGSRATFYTLINSGYGVGIAYTETKPDFTPTLSVRCVEAWPGNVSTRNNNHYGISYGSTFANFTYGNGYPIMGDKIWFAVNFPAESENCYVRQTVWVDGGGSTSRNVYSNSNTWYDVALSPTTVSADRSSYVVRARIDWIDGNGNVLKWGADKTFYIPVKPKINRYQVTMYDITGTASAYNGSAGSSGSVYVGQRAYAKYTYTSDNSWTSYNHLRGAMYQWQNNAWNRVKAWNSNTGDADLYVDSAGINKNSPYTRNSNLGFIRVPDNIANNNGSNRIPFYLWTHWSSDIDHTQESTWIDIPVVKADVALADIKLIDENGNYITGRNVWENQLVTPQYIYKNNTDCTVYIEGYDSDTSKMNGIYAISANGQIAVNGNQMRVGHGSTFSVWGGVYLEGAGRSAAWEKTDFDSQYNNCWLKYWYVQNPLKIEAVTPNSNYREGVQVITSFRVYNSSPTAFIPSDGATVNFTVYNASVGDGTEVCYTISAKTVVIPGTANNLIYFKWTVPEHLGGATLKIVADVKYNGKVKDTDLLSIKSTTVVNSQTADTSYESKKTSGWSVSSTPTYGAGIANWSEWIYENGGFIKKSYEIYVSGSNLTATPDLNSPSAEYNDSVWNIKSGYGYSLSWKPTVSVLSGSPTTAMYTAVQNGYAKFPEFNYLSTYGNYRSLQNVSGYLQFKENPAANGSRLHFIPVWYPNGIKNYTVSVYAYDCWTPAGMISVNAPANSMSIVGSLYDDYYLGRN